MNVTLCIKILNEKITLTLRSLVGEECSNMAMISNVPQEILKKIKWKTMMWPSIYTMTWIQKKKFEYFETDGKAIKLLQQETAEKNHLFKQQNISSQICAFMHVHEDQSSKIKLNIQNIK